MRVENISEKASASLSLDVVVIVGRGDRNLSQPTERDRSRSQEWDKGAVEVRASCTVRTCAKRSIGGVNNRRSSAGKLSSNSAKLFLITVLN